jgi:hypothetical protein
MIVHVTELSYASSQCWLSLSGLSVVVCEVTTLVRRVRCRPFVTSHMVIASELSSAIVPAGSWDKIKRNVCVSMCGSVDRTFINWRHDWQKLPTNR